MTSCRSQSQSTHFQYMRGPEYLGKNSTTDITIFTDIMDSSGYPNDHARITFYHLSAGLITNGKRMVMDNDHKQRSKSTSE